ncbi:4-hydroxybenzoate polyprenyltransferase [Prochlorococcus marinus]|uniref:4-hydroxybenzoate polyprenyltransferase n=1 Tax=Prochlorococcus marinus TaxID=1219 RepID=UPI0022B49475|nr:4-hydroxybenzoate polyprenyltransferase [Prochlorococcus marinus]
MKNFLIANKTLENLISLLRWNKPSGRLILLIPAGWALWLVPSAPPNGNLILLIILGGLLVSGSGCIANDLWDKKIDSKVQRTKNRPLANGSISINTALAILVLFLLLSLKVIFLLPTSSQDLCLKLAGIALLPILIYPSSKRWFKYPQILLAICWGFAVLIPWAASESSLNGGLPLLTCWLATMVWTFGFDTVYAMADKNDDKELGLNSSAIALGTNAFKIVSICYALTSLFIAISALSQGIGIIFWPFWILASMGMQRELISLTTLKSNMKFFGRHFRNQVFLGSLILLGLMVGNI